MDRFLGTVEELCSVNAGHLINWVAGIPFTEWPQQPKLPDGKIRPAMACDPDWHGFGDISAPIVDQIMDSFPDCLADTRMLSAVMPGHNIPPHVDLQSENWQCRIHVPLTTNDRSQFMVGGGSHHLVPGKAYKVNTLALHSVTNDGNTARIHFMFDVRKR